MATADGQAVLAVNKQFYVALNAMLAGDPKPFAEVYSHADDVSYMPADGSLHVGWDDVYESWVSQATAAQGGRVIPVRTHVVVEGRMAMTQSVIEGTLLAPDGESRSTCARETSVYRKEPTGWKIVAHQADAIPTWEEVMGTG